MTTRALTRIIAVAVSLGAAAPATRAQRIPLESDSRIRLEGTSTIHDWGCDAREMNAQLLAPRAFVRADSQAEETGIAELTLSIVALECGDDRMERQMRDVLQAAEFPEIRYLLTDYRILSDQGELRIEATGTITVAGVTRPIHVEVGGAVDDAAVLRVVGVTSFRMTDFGLRPPTAFFGLLKAGDRVEVHFDLRARMGDLREITQHLSTAR